MHPRTSPPLSSAQALADVATASVKTSNADTPSEFTNTPQPKPKEEEEEEEEEEAIVRGNHQVIKLRYRQACVTATRKAATALNQI